MTSHFVARETLHIAEEPISIEPFVFSLIEHLAVVLIGAALGRYADLHGAFAARIRAQTRSRNAHLFNCVDLRRSEREKARLKLIKSHGPLKKRFPRPEDGRMFMKGVDYDRRELLLAWSHELSNHIVKQWEEIDTHYPIAVIL